MYVICISGGAHMISKIADWVATSFEALGTYILCSYIRCVYLMRVSCLKDGGHDYTFS